MSYLTQSQVKSIIDSAPKGSKPEDIVSELLSRGHTLEGFGNAAQVQSMPPPQSLLQSIGNVVNKVFPGEKVGQAIGTLAGYGLSKLQGTSQYYDTSAPSVKQVAGDVISGASLVGGLKLPLSSSILKTAAQFGGLSGASALGSGLANNTPTGQLAMDVGKSAAIGGVLGVGFGLLGKAISSVAKKAGPPALSFTTRVPEKAIQEAIKSPSSYKLGLKTNVAELQKKAADALTNQKTGLFRALSDEFADGMETISQKYGYGGKLGTIPQSTSAALKYPGGGVNLPAFNKAGAMATKGNVATQGPKIGNQVKSLVNDFRLTSKDGVIDFSKSAITKTAEHNNIQTAFETVKNWSDYTPQGLQTLAERIGNLRKFDTVSGTKQSALLGQIYNKIAGNGGIIERHYPELKVLRTNFSKTTTILDEIGSVVGVKAKTPIARTSVINRLSNLFKEDKELYINALRMLSEKSGTDILGQLAGTEFQQLLPHYIKGLGGGGAIAIGASVLNPWLLLLAPLFSPRFAGKLVEVSPAIANTTKTLIRGASGQVVPKLAPTNSLTSPTQ